jgi:hypothetical protein
MFIDASGALGREHSRDLRRDATEYRIARAAHREHHTVREFLARGQLGPAHSYIAR